MRLPIMNEAITSCVMCPVGRSSGVGHGGHCPFIDRARQAGEFLYFEGEPATTVWFVKRGTVLLSRATREDGGGDGARAVRRDGHFLGLEALIAPTYVDSARAVTAVKLCGAPIETVDSWLGGRDAPARMALEQTCRMMYTEAPRAAGPDGNAVRRVARWLLTDGSTAGDVPRRFVANLLGMVPETLSRALAQLSKEGAIVLTRRTVRVRDAQVLRTLAGTPE
jgi:CRP-like cAMP-binding protein